MKKRIIGIAGIGIGIVAGGLVSICFKNKSDALMSGKIEKFKGYYNMLNQWLMLKQEGKSLEKYFEDNGYKNIAIYGMGEIGNRLYNELKDSKKVKIKYVIDKNADVCSETRIFNIDDNLPDVDVVIVTATFAFDEIKEELGKRLYVPVISINDVIYSI